jgi:hypothetical protein
MVRAGLAMVLLALLVEAAHLTVFRDPLAKVRADAASALQALDHGDLVAVDRLLAANRGQADFAYFFTSKATPRELGDALATAAGPSKKVPLRTSLDAHAYDLALADLAGTLSLATYGTGDRTLPSSWTSDFIGATTTPEALYDEAEHNPSTPSRAAQDVANKQNLLLLLSRGYWSTGFLKAVTETYWKFDRANSGDAWPGPARQPAKYAPASDGTYLTDGVLALTAALTTNPAASAWAFKEFQPGSDQIDGSKYRVGKFTHYLLFEHQFPKVSDGGSVGMTAALTALSSATIATRGEVAAKSGKSGLDESEDSGPLHDSIVLQALAQDLTHDGCSLSHRDFWNCAKVVAEAAGHWVQHWGHEVLDILSLATFAPPPFAVVGVAAAATNATWYAVGDDYRKAGLSLAVAVPGLAFVKIAEAAKAGVTAEHAAAEASDVAKAVMSIRVAADRTINRELAEAGAARVAKSPRTFRLERDAEDMVAREFPGSTTQMRFNPPGCQVLVCPGQRFVDVWVPPKTAIELKIGFRNDAHALQEIQKDLALLRDKNSEVKSLEWRFYPDAGGRVGPSPKVRELLLKNRIRYVMYVP